RETGGTGLGLAVANSIILAHGGELTLANRPEGGLRVTLLLNQLKK
ncbi:MAG: ATP-binding protein, partial [Candidatus Thiodiazotropha taylori]